jgi:hypothetical protein
MKQAGLVFTLKVHASNYRSWLLNFFSSRQTSQTERQMPKWINMDFTARLPIPDKVSNMNLPNGK